jgi:hypothetical protein
MDRIPTIAMNAAILTDPKPMTYGNGRQHFSDRDNLIGEITRSRHNLNCEIFLNIFIIPIFIFPLHLQPTNQQM